MITSATRRHESLIALDLLRFACATSVVAFHYLAAPTGLPSRHGALVLAGLDIPKDLYAVSWWGWVGVPIFFMISGYVIAISASGNGARPVAFLRRRALRLFPAAFVCATVSATIISMAQVEPIGVLLNEWWVSVLLLPTDRPIDASYWTLPVEIAFYLLVALALAVLPSCRPVQKFGLTLGVLSIGMLLFGPHIAVQSSFDFVGLKLLQYGPAFALGIALSDFHESPAVRGLRLAWLIALSALVLACVHADACERSARMGVASSPWLPVGVVAAAVLVVTLAPRLQAPLARAPWARHSSTLGLMTYPLYLIHYDAGLTIAAALTRTGVPYFLAVAVAAMLSFGFAWIMVSAIEPSLRGWLASLKLTPRRALLSDTLPTASPRAG